MWRILWFISITLFFHFWELLELLLLRVTTSMDRGSHLEHIWMGTMLPICFLGIMGIPYIIFVVFIGFLFIHVVHMSMDGSLSFIGSSWEHIFSFYYV